MDSSREKENHRIERIKTNNRVRPTIIRQEIFNEFPNELGNSNTLLYTLGEIIKNAKGKKNYLTLKPLTERKRVIEFY